MNLIEVLDKFEDPNTSPGELSAMNLWLATEFARKSQDYSALINKKNVAWLAVRDKYKSDKQADKAWDATVDGQLETTLRMYLKSVEKLMSSIRAHLRIKETEAKNFL